MSAFTRATGSRFIQLIHCNVVETGEKNDGVIRFIFALDANGKVRKTKEYVGVKTCTPGRAECSVSASPTPKSRQHSHGSFLNRALVVRWLLRLTVTSPSRLTSHLRYEIRPEPYSKEAAAMQVTEALTVLRCGMLNSYLSRPMMVDRQVQASVSCLCKSGASIKSRYNVAS